MAAEAEQGLEGGHRRPSPVEAEGELVEVGLKVRVADTVMSPAEPGLQVAKHTVDARQDLARPSRVALRTRSVAVAHLRERDVVFPGIGEHYRASCHIRSRDYGTRNRGLIASWSGEMARRMFRRTLKAAGGKVSVDTNV